MFTLPSQPTTGMFASKEAGLELTSPARSRKNARNFTNRMAHSLLTACCNVCTFTSKIATCQIKGQRLRELHPCQHAPPLSCILAAAPPPNTQQSPHAACRGTERLTHVHQGVNLEWNCKRRPGISLQRNSDGWAVHVVGQRHVTPSAWSIVWCVCLFAPDMS